MRKVMALPLFFPPPPPPTPFLHSKQRPLFPLLLPPPPPPFTPQRPTSRTVCLCQHAWSWHMCVLFNKQVFPGLSHRVRFSTPLHSVQWSSSLALYRLVDLVVKVSASRAEDPEFESRFCRDSFGVESYQ